MPEDSVEANPGAGSTAGSTGPDSGSNGSAAPAADTQTGAAQTVGDSSASSGSTPTTAKATQTADGDQSLTDGAETNPPQDYQKRFIGAQKSWQQERAQREALQKRLAEMEARAKRFEGVPLDEAVEQFQKSRGKEPWEPESPEHPRFKDLWNRTQVVNDLARRAEDPAFRKALLDQHFESLSTNEREWLQRHQQMLRSREMERQLNPDAYFARIAQQYAQPVVQQGFQTAHQQQQEAAQAVGAVQAWMRENPDLATQENRAAIAQIMQDRRMRFEQAVVQWERDYFRGKVSGIDAKAKSVEEKERLLQGKAAGAITRNPSTKKGISVSSYLKEQNIPLNDSNRVANALFDLEAKSREAGVPLLD